MVWEVAVGMVAKVVRGIIMAVLLMVVFTYGDAHLSCELGSGSGNDNSAGAIAGGGIIVMGSLEHPLPTLSIDGSLKADGESFGENTTERDGVIISNIGPRGGSGGTILLFVHALAIGNSSIISTVGGNGSPHGGGDGRVHFHWADIPVGDEYLPIANGRGSIHTGGVFGMGQSRAGENGTVTRKPCPKGLYGIFCEVLKSQIFVEKYSESIRHTFLDYLTGDVN